MNNWDEFLSPYEQAVNELKIKFRGLRASFVAKNEHSPIEFVVGRVKTRESIEEKMQRRLISPEVIEQDMQDIAGIRIMVQFVDDIYDLVELIRNRSDMTIVEERDYISNAKPSGYRSYHIVISYKVFEPSGEKTILAEIQVRTLAMNFWATVEHSLNYKYNGEYPEEISQRLKNTAETAFKLDEEMSLIKDEVQAAQHDFNQHKRNQ